MHLPDMPGLTFDPSISTSHAQSASEMILDAAQPFRYEACLDYLSRSPLECLYEVDNGQIRRLLRFENSTLLLGIDSPDERTLRLTPLQPEQPDGSLMRLAARYVWDWFDLGRDLTSFYRLAEESPVLCGLPEAFLGLRLIGVPDLFEALCWAVIGQQVNLPFAYTLKKRLTEAYGEYLEWNERLYYSFPRPERLLKASEEELRGLSLTRAKAAALLRVAELTASGELSKEKLLEAGSFEAAGRSLLQIRGIGPWTAQYVMMRCLRDPRALPAGDAGLQNAVKRRLGMERKPTQQELVQLFELWGDWQAYAVFYLWRTLY